MFLPVCRLFNHLFQSLKAAGQACAQKAKAHPQVRRASFYPFKVVLISIYYYLQLMVIILPEAGNAEIYRAVKQ